jgi:hypothetical protein
MQPTMDFRAEAERHFLEGKSAAEAALELDTCPYRDAREGDIPEREELIARLNWTTGWRFARYVALQRGRASKRNEIVAALAELVQLEAPYAELLAILRRGPWPHPIRFYRASRSIKTLAHGAWTSQSVRLLSGLGITTYLPYYRERAYPTIAFFDRQLSVISNNNAEDEMRKLVERYGDAHGIKAAWSAYCHAERLRDLVAEAGASPAIHVY